MDLQTLLTREALKDLKARFCLALDYKDWDTYAALFTQDGTIDVDGAVNTRGEAPEAQTCIRGRSAIRATIPEILAQAETVHQVHSPILDVLSPTQATGIWAMEDIVRTPDFLLEGRGHYRETYAIEDGKWRIASLHLTRIWLQMRPSQDASPRA
jgi:hypothetical protein